MQFKTYIVNKENGVKIGRVVFNYNAIVTEDQAHKRKMRLLAKQGYLKEKGRA